jgi:hypothetical protein
MQKNATRKRKKKRNNRSYKKTHSLSCQAVNGITGTFGREKKDAPTTPGSALKEKKRDKERPYQPQPQPTQTIYASSQAYNKNTKLVLSYHIHHTLTQQTHSASSSPS